MEEGGDKMRKTMKTMFGMILLAFSLLAVLFPHEAFALWAKAFGTPAMEAGRIHLCRHSR